MALTYIISAIIILLSLLVQGHPSFDSLRFAGTKPDLLFIAVVYFGYSFGSFYGQVTGFIGGLFHDSISKSPLGLMALPKLLIGYMMGMLGRDLVKSNVLTVFLMVFVASLVKGLITIILCMIFHEAYLAAIKNVIFPEALYNALLAVILFPLYDKIFSSEISGEGYR